MAKAKKAYVCGECGAHSVKWAGQCPECLVWNTLAEQLGCLALSYPIAFDLGRWYETVGQEQESVVLYAKAKAAVEHMAIAIEDEGLRAIFRKSAPVQAIHDCAVRENGLRTSGTKGGPAIEKGFAMQKE